MVRYKAMMDKALQAFHQWEILQVNRSKNVDANTLTCLGEAPSPLESRWGRVINMSAPSMKAAKNLEIKENEDWRSPILKYIDKGIPPDKKMEKTEIRQKAPWYRTINGSLY